MTDTPKIPQVDLPEEIQSMIELHRRWTDEMKDQESALVKTQIATKALGMQINQALAALSQAPSAPPDGTPPG